MGKERKRKVSRQYYIKYRIQCQLSVITICSQYTRTSERKNRTIETPKIKRKKQCEGITAKTAYGCEVNI